MGYLMAKDGTIIGDEEQPWRFIPHLPEENHIRTRNKWDHDMYVFWSQTEPPQKRISSPSTAHLVYPEYWDIHQKIKSAFCNVNLSPYNKGLILQFWAIVQTTDKNVLLTTSNQPFSFEDNDLVKYRLLCMRRHTPHYEPTAACMNKFPEVIPDLKVYKGIRFFNKLINFGFTCCISLPLFYHYPKYDGIYPVGVVQCCMKKRTGLLAVFNQLKSSLVSLGLQTYSILPPYKNIDAIKPARDEIKEALEIVCQSYHLPLAQVWILNHKHSYIPYLSPPPIKEENSTRGLFVFKLCGYVSADDYGDNMSLFSSVIKDYYDTCDVVPLRLGDGLVGKTLETRQPHFCRNIDKLRMNGVSAPLSGSTECRCLVICLRSIHTTDDVDYAFEFLWPKTRDYLILMESLLLTLKTCLPNFKLPSGAQLGDELRVLDVDTSTSFNLLQENKFSLIPKVLEKQPLLHGEQEPNSRKRKLREFFETDCKCVDQSDSDLSPEENSDVVILAAYKENVVRFITRTSNTLSYARKIIEERFNLDHGTYSMEYEFGGERATMDTDQDLDRCMKLWTSYLERRGRKGHIVVLVSTP